MSSARRLHYTYAEYLDALQASALKLEYCDGEIYAMAGGTPNHAQLAAAVIRLLGNALAGRCHVYSSDLKIRIDSTDLSTFPDAAVICGERQVSPIDPNAVINPTLLVEITSASTEDYDRGDKLNHYRQVPSLRAVVIVSHRRPQISVVERVGSGWQSTHYHSGDRVVLRDPDLEVLVDDVYVGVVLPRLN